MTLPRDWTAIGKIVAVALFGVLAAACSITGHDDVTGLFIFLDGLAILFW